MQHETPGLTWDERFDLARSFGVTEQDAYAIAQFTHCDPKGTMVMLCAWLYLRGHARRRTPKNLRRFVLRNRFERNRVRHNFWEGQQRRHIRAVMQEKSGMRCYDCKDVPPQPGEIMEEEG